MATKKQPNWGHNKSRTYYPALRGIFGDWVYYSCLMSLDDVGARLSFSDDIHASKELSDWIQRKIKGKRTEEIATYLIREKQRFFNSLVVAIYGGEPAWHGFSNFKSLASDINLEDIPDEVEDSVGFLSFSGDEEIFAIDGQHRLAGIKEAIRKDSELAQDDVSLVIVSHSKTKAGMERTRRLFTTLNKTAVPVGKGEIIALDENDAMAIVTRWLVDNDPRFSAERRIKLSANENLPKDAIQWTTIGNIYDVLHTLFLVVPGKKTKEEKADLRRVRPNESELHKYISFARGFFDRLSEISLPLRKCFAASDEEAATLTRRYRGESAGAVLLRPVGLRIFAEVCARLIDEGLGVEHAYSLLSKLPSKLSDLPYKGVIWDPVSKTMNPSGRPICRRLLLHMLGHENKPDDLLSRYAKALGVDRGRVSLPKLLT